VTVGDSVWPPSAVLLGGLRNDDTAGQSEDAAQSASHRLNDSGIELVSSASSSSASDSWLAQVPFVSHQQQVLSYCVLVSLVSSYGSV